MKRIFIVIFIISSCQQIDSNSYMKSCIRIEHVGEADGFYPPTIISTSKNWCGLNIKSPRDTLRVNLQVIDSSLYLQMRKYVLNNKIVYDLDYLHNEVICAGYGIDLIEDGQVVISYPILRQEDYKEYFRKLNDEMIEFENSKDFIKSLNFHMPARNFYCRDR